MTQYFQRFSDFLHNFAGRSYARGELIVTIGFFVAGVLGLLAGILFVRNPVTTGILNQLDVDQPLQRLVLGIVLFIAGMAISGGILGAIGGWLLTIVDALAPVRRYVLTGALAFAIPQAIVTPIAILLTSLIGIYYNNIDTNPMHLSLLFGIFGLFYGMLMGLLLGFSSVGFRYGWGVLFFAMLGGVIGGTATGWLMMIVMGELRMGELLAHRWLLLLILSTFYGVMGLFLGPIYVWFHRARMEGGKLPHDAGRFWRIIAVFAIVVLLLNLVGTFSQLYSFAMMHPASTSPVLVSEARGVAWNAPQQLKQGSAAFPPDMAAASDGRLGLVWTQQGSTHSEITLSQAAVDESGQPAWGEPIRVSSPDGLASNPQIAADEQGNWLIVWEEVSAEGSGSGQIMFSRCQGDDCTQPMTLSTPSSCATAARNPSSPVIAVDDADGVMVVWQIEDGTMLFTSWTGNASPPSPDCLPFGGELPQLTAAGAGAFVLTYEQGDDVALARYASGAWSAAPLWQEPGHDPTIFRDREGTIHAAWCKAEGDLRYWNSQDNAFETIDAPACSTRPALSEDGYGRVHVIWHGSQVIDNFDQVKPGSFLYDGMRLTDGWGPAVIVARTQRPLIAAAATGGDAAMHLAWIDGDQLVWQSSQPHYTCPDSTGSPYGDAILHLLQTDPYRPPGAPVPFCNNEFLALFFLPEPAPDEPKAPSPHGAFDDVGQQIREARFEVLFATMEWEADEHMDSPGFVFAQAVTDLYQKVKAHPEDYPRGMTVRVLLGNYPELATFTWGQQVWNVMDVLQKAGLPEMENPDLGWKVELANFDGQNPHSHAKFLIIDGQKVMAAGFNYSYLHLLQSDPSGLGVSLVDFGMFFRGPVAQDAVTGYDDLWDGSTLVQCPDLNPPDGDWSSYCTEIAGGAVASHVPEALLYYPTSAHDVAFSLLRTYNRPESDKALEALIRSAQDTIDIFEVNFSMELYCSLGIIMDDFCSMDDALPYMDALLDVMETNGVHIRVLTTDVNMNGIENSVAIETFKEALESRGLSDQAEFRYYDGRMHAKAFLVDDAFLVVGSQNFHYSAWGDGKGLVEYNLATNSDAAIAEFQDAFEFYWSQSKPVVKGEIRSE